MSVAAFKGEIVMNQTMGIFVSGIAGVFVGMALLYAAIKLNTLVTQWILRQREDKA